MARAPATGVGQPRRRAHAEERRARPPSRSAPSSRVSPASHRAQATDARTPGRSAVHARTSACDAATDGRADEGVDPGRLRRARPAVARAARLRPPDVGEGDRRAHRAPPAVPRADPARGEGRRAGALEARRRRRLRARPPARGDHARRHPRRGRRPAHHAAWASTTTARATASCRRCGSACPTRPARSSSGFTLAELVERTRIGHPDVLDSDATLRSRRRSRADVGRGATTPVAAPHPHHDLEATRRRRLERDVAAVAAPPARARSTARGRSGRSGRPSRRASPDCQKRSNARARSSARHPRPLVADAQLDPVAPLAARRRAPRCPAGATSSALFSRLSTTCSRRPGVARATGDAGDVGVDVHVLLGRERVPRVAPPVEHLVDARPARATTMPARRARARADRRRAATAARPRSSAPSRSSAAAPCTSASRFSSRSRMAASGVRNWCDASATKRALRADELFEARRGRVERLREHGQLGRAAAAPRRAPRGRRRPSEPAAVFEVGERLGHRTREQQAGQEHDAEHDPTGRREQQPDVADLVVDHRGRVRDAHRALDAGRRADRQRDVEQVLARASATTACRSPRAPSSARCDLGPGREVAARSRWSASESAMLRPSASTMTTRPPASSW